MLNLSADLKSSIPEAGGLFVSNLKYMRYFYALYAYRQQVVDDKELSEVAAELIVVPWGHHINIIDKCKGDRGKAKRRRTSLSRCRRRTVTSENNPPAGVLVCKDHNRVLAKLHLEELGLPMGITNCELKKVLPTQTQFAKCYADAEAQSAVTAPKTKKNKEAK